MTSKLLRLAVLASLAIGCNPPPDAGKNDKPAPSDGADKAGDEEDAAPMGLPPIARMFTAGLDKPGPYEEPRQSPDYEDGKPHHLVLELHGSIDELESLDLFAGAMGKPLRDITDTLHAAAADPNVKGLVLRAADVSLDMATAEELRGQLVAFKGDGARSVRCHAEVAANSVYYLLTACDQLVLAPLGELAIPGPAATPVHVKGLMDKLGLQADFLHVGAFKGAAEPLTRDAPSPEMMTTLDAIVARSYDTMVAGIVEGRKVDEAAAKAAIDQAMILGPDAVSKHLVDEIATWEAFLPKATDGAPWKLHRDEKGAVADFGALQRFLGLLPPERPSAPHVALVYAVGNVIDGKGNGIVGAREEIASRTLVSTLRALAKDDSVKAVVLRVNSPGGSALASEQIWHAVTEVRAKKPVVVSMGGVAASGGYYISVAANKIYANANTLTGSIGVVGGKIVVGPALDRIGIKSYEVHRGQRALMGSPMTPWTEPERATVQAMMESIYEDFLAHVVENRKMKRDDVHALAQGRVWTGADAKANGLVDEVGGLEAALAEARKLGSVPADVELEVYPGKPTIRDLITSFAQVQAGVRTPVRAAVEELAALAGPAQAQAVASMLQLVEDMRGTKAWAVSWVRPPR